jgi:adenylosuccinate synthase
VKVCVAYRIGGSETTSFPGSADLARLEPAYRVFPGWREDLSEARRFDDLPQSFRQFVKFLETFLGVPVTAVSTGPERGQLVRSTPA